MFLGHNEKCGEQHKNFQKINDSNFTIVMAWKNGSWIVLWINGSNSTLLGKVSFTIFKFMKKFTIWSNYRQIGVGHQSISMIWTARAVGTFFACTMSGQVFGSSWMSTTRRKLLYFASAHLIISISMYNIPFLFNLIQTLVCFGFMTFATGSYDVADNGFVHQKFGTKMSRPVIQSLHAFASVGFLSCKSASFIANLFQRVT